jgi:hypothetical protein
LGQRGPERNANNLIAFCNLIANKMWDPPGTVIGMALSSFILLVKDSNEYKESFLGQRGPERNANNLIAFCNLIVNKMWDPPGPVIGMALSSFILLVKDSNEYKESFLGQRGPECKATNLTALCDLIVNKMCDPPRPVIGISLPSFILLVKDIEICING